MRLIGINFGIRARDISTTDRSSSNDLTSNPAITPLGQSLALHRALHLEMVGSPCQPLELELKISYWLLKPYIFQDLYSGWEESLAGKWGIRPIF